VSTAATVTVATKSTACNVSSSGGVKGAGAVGCSDALVSCTTSAVGVGKVKAVASAAVAETYGPATQLGAPALAATTTSGASITKRVAEAKGTASATTAAITTQATSAAAIALAASAVPGTVTKEQRIEMMLKETGFEEDENDEGVEPSFEELLEQEKAFFKAKSEKLSFPRTGGKESGGKRRHRF
jgi:hypothetical protein